MLFVTKQCCFLPCILETIVGLVGDCWFRLRLLEVVGINILAEAGHPGTCEVPITH